MRDKYNIVQPVHGLTLNVKVDNLGYVNFLKGEVQDPGVNQEETYSEQSQLLRSWHGNKFAKGLKSL